MRLDREKEAPNRARPVTVRRSSRPTRALALHAQGTSIYNSSVRSPFTKSSNPHRQTLQNLSGSSIPRRGATEPAVSVPQAQSIDRAGHSRIGIPSLLLDERRSAPWQRSLGRRYLPGCSVYPLRTNRVVGSVKKSARYVLRERKRDTYGAHSAARALDILDTAALDEL